MFTMIDAMHILFILIILIIRYPVEVAQRFADHVKVLMHATRALELEIPARARHHALAYMGHKLLRFGRETRATTRCSLVG
jgi:hypothetical protein